VPSASTFCRAARAPSHPKTVQMCEEPAIETGPFCWPDAEVGVRKLFENRHLCSWSWRRRWPCLNTIPGHIMAPPLLKLSLLRSSSLTPCSFLERS
jgi:hypothetical protein